MNNQDQKRCKERTNEAFDAVRQGIFPQWFASQNCEPEALNELIDVNAQEGYLDRTLLSCACWFDNVWFLDKNDEAICILSKICNPNTLDVDGFTALHLLARGQGPFASSLSGMTLLKAGADPQIRCPQGLDALCHAANRGAEELVRVLIGPCDPLTRTHSGMTPLMLAATSRWDEEGCCAALLVPVSDLRARDSEGLSAFDHAKRCQSPALGSIHAAMEAQELASMIEKKFMSTPHKIKVALNRECKNPRGSWHNPKLDVKNDLQKKGSF